jgi:hypothetical protein
MDHESMDQELDTTLVKKSKHLEHILSKLAYRSKVCCAW